jgi:hypothetical protein
MVINFAFGAISVIFLCKDVRTQLLATACLAGKLAFHNIVRFRTDGAVAARANLNKKYIVPYYSRSLSMPPVSYEI